MIDRSVLLWSAKELRKQYREMLKVNTFLKNTLGMQFPFVTPHNAWKVSEKDRDARDAVLMIPLQFDLIGIENEFKQVYKRHVGIINFFKTEKS